MRISRLVACAAVPLLLAAILAGLWFVRAPKVSASLYDLIGQESERIPQFLRDASASEIAVIVSSKDAKQAEQVAEQFAALPIAVAPGDLPPNAIDFIRSNRGGLVTEEQAELLAATEGRTKLAKRAMRRLFASPVPPILGYEDDPFGLTDAFLMSLSGRSSVGRTAARGCPVVVTNGVTRIFVKCRIGNEVSANIDRTIECHAKLKAMADALSSPEIEVRFAGAPIHAALSAAKSKSEIGWLTWFSLAFIVGLALIVFRSWKWIPLLASSLAVSALAGSIALVALFQDMHVMTMVMGTTVLGLVIDYSFHWLLSSEADKPAVRKNLLVSFLTTEISLVPLMLATIPVLRQSAVFLGVGLAAALAYVLWSYPCEGEGQRSEVKGRTKVSVLHCSTFNLQLPTFTKLFFVMLAVIGLFSCEIKTEITALYRPSAELLEAERQRAAFGEFDFTKIPTLSARRDIAANVAKLYDEHGAEMAKTLELKSLVPPPAPTDALVRPQTLMETIFAAWTTDALKRLGLSVAALLAVLVLFCRLRAFRIFVPPLAALLSVAGVLGWMEIPINLFHLLAMFLLLGMGIDYAVFLQSGNKAALRPALSSLLTSMAGFGALAFVSFPVVASFGVVLGIGLPVAFVLALNVGAAYRRIEGTEKAASPLGLELLWLLYCVFGLRFLHLLAAAVGLCVWTFSLSVRRASPSFRKVVNFTQSLADKLVVMAEGRHLPHVETDGSADAAAFLDDVRTGKGVFILSSHVGTIEVLTALGECNRTFHAWMDFDRTSVFNRFYLRHAKRRRVVIHPISEFGMQTVFEAGDLIDSGGCLLMAGDRGDGSFSFAAAFDHPVYFVACVCTDGCHYRAIIRRLPSERKVMKAEYDQLLRELSERYPTQHYAWHNADVV